MALTQSDVSEPLVALRAGDGTELVRELAQWALQQLIEAEAAWKIGAARYERSDARVTYRNGSGRKTLSRKAGDLVVGIPKLRAGSFFLSLFRAPPPHQPGPVRGGHGGLCERGVHPVGRRPGGGHRGRHGHLQVRGLPHLCGSGRAGGSLLQPDPWTCGLPRRLPEGHGVKPNFCCSGRTDGRMRANSNKSVACAPLFFQSYTLFSPRST